MGIPQILELKFLWRHQISNYLLFSVFKNATFHVHRESQGKLKSTPVVLPLEMFKNPNSEFTRVKYVK